MSRKAATAAKARRAKIAARTRKLRDVPLIEMERPDYASMDANRIANILASAVHKMSTGRGAELPLGAVARAVELLREHPHG